MFHVPIPIPCAEAGRQAGEGSHGCLGRAQASGNYMPWWPGAPSPSQPSPVRFSPVWFAGSRSLPELPCRIRAKPLRAAVGLPGSASTHRALNKAKGLHAGQNIEEKDPSEAGLGELVTLAQPALLGELCQPERKWQLPITALFGDKEKTVFSLLKLIAVRRGCLPEKKLLFDSSSHL